MVDLDQAHVIDLRHPPLRKLVGRVVALHIRRLIDDAGAVRGIGHRPRLVDRVADRLLDQDVLAGPGGRDGGRRMRARVADDDGVDIRPLDQLVIVNLLPLRRHAVGGPNVRQQLARQVAQAGDLKVARQLDKVRQMLDLGNAAAPNDAHPQPAHHRHHP